MELFATGFNAWRQLQFDNKRDNDNSDEPRDLSSFQSILKDDFIGCPCSLLSCTFVKTASAGIRNAGFMEDISERLKEKLLSSTAAVAWNGTVAEYDGHGTIRQYSSTGTREQQSFSGLGNIAQLAAYETGFVALSHGGHVWTWGDERYSACLGRPVTPSSPAERPGLVEELEDLPTGKIKKISAAGYLVLALTEGHDLYAWGGRPGQESVLEDISSSPTPVLVEESDIFDCGVGESHVIVLSSEGHVYVIGDNGNGQLGLPDSKVYSWTRVPLRLEAGQVVCGVEAGRSTSFILAKY
ncbi:RCC1/BLIP-II [Daldinia caldariorum]|uniref:RCC1/BLIP-II n=1 Tax=Daldinia caldariorum TaxID=326644 RepID=UPI002007F397|nr:RCC1/BLIP-II [Daldinia caldariorum]KAI1471064.1 RCC1/BLIP-II [Daldinia caldariorum]